MSSTTSRTQMVDRRGELLIELFLEDLGPEFVAQATADFGYDFLMGFRNADGGINTAGVVAKATEQPVRDRFRFPKKLYDQLAHSNIPIILLVANVKENRLYYAWIARDEVNGRENGQMVSVPVVAIDDEAKEAILRRLAG